MRSMLALLTSASLCLSKPILAPQICAPSRALQDKSDAAIDGQRNVAIEICAQGASSALAFQQNEGFGHGEIPAFVKDEAGFNSSVGEELPAIELGKPVPVFRALSLCHLLSPGPVVRITPSRGVHGS